MNSNYNFVTQNFLQIRYRKMGQIDKTFDKLIYFIGTHYTSNIIQKF